MLNEVSAKINKKMMLEEATNDFKMAIQEDASISILDEDAFGIQNNRNGEELTMFEEDFFMEATEYDPELTTSLQDETDACDDTHLEDPSDFTSDTDLFKEVDYDDNYNSEFVNDTDVNTLLDKETDYHDTYNKDADVSAFVDESAELLAECGDGSETELDEDSEEFMNEDFFMESDEEDTDLEEDFFMEGGQDGTIPDADDVSDITLEEDFFMESDEEDTDLEEDFFMESDDNDSELPIMDEDFFMEADEEDTDLEEDFFMESDEEVDDETLEEDFFMEGGIDGTIPDADDVSDIDLDAELEDPTLNIDSYFAEEDLDDTDYLD